jgi:hypothetical protein
MEGSGQLQGPAASKSEKKPAASIGYEAKWTLEKI